MNIDCKEVGKEILEAVDRKVYLMIDGVVDEIVYSKVYSSTNYLINLIVNRATYGAVFNLEKELT